MERINFASFSVAGLQSEEDSITKQPTISQPATIHLTDFLLHGRDGINLFLLPLVFGGGSIGNFARSRWGFHLYSQQASKQATQKPSK